MILKEMFQRADLVDLYSLADPERCKKYIVVGATALKKLFASINLEPKRGDDGIIYFQKIEGIQKANPMGDEQITMCKYLAFYFIRIFQIYAALTLSVIDSELPQVDPSAITAAAAKNRRGVLVVPPPELKGFSPAKRTFWGGALSSTSSGSFYLNPEVAGTYKLLNQVLLVPVDPGGDMRFQENNDITIAQADLYDNPALPTRQVKNFSDRGTVRPNVLYSFSSGSNFRNISGRLFLEIATDGSIDVILKDIKIADKDTIIKDIKEKLMNRRPGDENPVSSKGKNITGVLQELFLKAIDKIEPPVFSAVNFLKKYNIIGSGEGQVKIEQTNIIIPNTRDYANGNRIPMAYKINFKVDDRSVPITITADLLIEKQAKIVLKPQEYIVRVNMEGVTTKPDELKSRLDLKKERWRKFSTGEADNSTPLSEKGESIAAYLESVFKKLLTKEGEEGGISYNAQGRPKPYNIKGEDEELKVKKIWDALIQNPPVKAHCVARAVQLLNVAAIKGVDDGAYSSVCRVKFPYIKQGSLPEPGKDILTSNGIYSLAMLFIDRLMGKEAVPKISNTEKFQEFQKKLKFFFERYQTLEDTPAPAGLKDINEKMMPFCEGHTEDKIYLKGGLVGKLRSKVNALMNKQASHVGNVMVMIFKLFDERSIRAGTYAINPKVMAGGMEAVNAIAEESRNLLIEYYGDCEKTYKEGLFEIYSQGTNLEFVKID